MIPQFPCPTLDDIVLDWVEPFAASKRNPRADLPVVADQRRDYRQKVTTLAEAFELKHGQPMRLADLFGPEPDIVLRARRHPQTGAPLRAQSRNAYRRVLNAFVTWLRETCRLPDNGRIPWKMEAVGEPNLTVFEPEHIEAMFMHLAKRDSISNRRLTAQIALAVDCGPRVCDVLSMRLSKLDLERGRATLWVKNNKEVTVPLGSLARIALRRYLELRVDGGRHDLVFLNTAGTAPIIGDRLSKAFRRLLLTLGVVRPASERGADDLPATPERLSFQTLRRTFVKYYLDAGRNQRELIGMLGWDPRYAHEVFEYYTRVGIEELEAVHEASSPLTRLLRRP